MKKFETPVLEVVELITEAITNNTGVSGGELAPPEEN